MKIHNRRAFLRASGCTVATALLSGCSSTGTVERSTEKAKHSTARPNIVFILADDLGYGDIGCFGSETIRTPNLDRMAREGMKFTDFYVNAPVCSPVRAGFLTGRAQQRCGAETVFTPRRMEDGLPLNESTLAEHLRDGGYTTGIFGKWHLGYADRHNPVNRGFDRFIGALSGFLDYQTRVNPAIGYDWRDGLELVESTGYSTDLIGADSIAFVRANKDRPFFLFVSHQAPHSPFQGPEDAPEIELVDGKTVRHKSEMDAAQRYETYVEMVERLDSTVGDLRKVLDEEGLSRNTLVLFASDNGPSYLAGLTGGLRGGKHSLWEGGIRVPAIACWPGRIRSGVVTDEPLTILDLFPTFLSLARIPLPQEVPYDGIDAGPLLLKGKPLPDRPLLWRYEPSKQAAVRWGKWKLMGRYDPATGKSGFDPETAELYNLEEDVEETRNLVADHPGIVERLKTAHAAWEKSIATDPRRLERMSDG